MLDWHSCQICYPLEIKLLLLLYSTFCLFDRPCCNKVIFFKTPPDVTKNMKTLSAYLTEPCKSDLEKARAFYYWICNNIG